MRVRNHFTARPCPCGDKVCKDWVINYPELRVTEVQAKAAATLLNAIESDPEHAKAITMLYVKMFNPETTA